MAFINKNTWIIHFTLLENNLSCCGKYLCSTVFAEQNIVLIFLYKTPFNFNKSKWKPAELYSPAPSPARLILTGRSVKGQKTGRLVLVVNTEESVWSQLSWWSDNTPERERERDMLIILTLQLSLQLGRVLTGSSAALEPEQFLQMMAEMSSRLEERRAEEGLVGHYNSARCSTTYQEVCTTQYSQECHNQVSLPSHPAQSPCLHI